MRLLTRNKIYRAFPELDPFTNEQCRRFIRAAQAPRTFVGVLLIIALASLVIGATLCFVLVPLVASNLGYSGPRPSEEMPLGLVGVVILFAGLFAGGLGMWARDFVLLQRLRVVLHHRGRCGGCKYSLVGLTVGVDLKVTCPECGYVTEVDPSLGSLVRDDLGRALFQPEAAMATDPQAMLTPEFRRAIAKWSKRSLFTLLIGTLCLVAGVEVWLRTELSSALKTYNADLGYAGLLQSVGVSPPAPGASAWEMLPGVMDLVGKAEQHAGVASYLIRQGEGFDGYWLVGGYGTPDEEFRELYLSAPVNQPRTRVLGSLQREATAAIDAMEQNGAMARVRAMIEMPTLALSLQGSTETEVARQVAADRTKSLQALFQILDGRMNLARSRHDPELYRRAMHDALGAARMAMATPFHEVWFIGVTQEARVWAKSIRVIHENQGHAWLDAIAQETNAYQRSLPLSAALRGSEAAGQHELARLYSELLVDRFGTIRLRASEWIKPSFGGSRRGTYWSQSASISEFYGATLAQCDRTPWERLGVPQSSRYGRSTAWGRAWSNAPSYLFAGSDRAALLRAGLITTLRVEAYRLEHGGLPASLNSLPDAASLPLDPYSGKLLGYTTSPPATVPGSPEYVVYSVGTDFLDDGLARPSGLETDLAELGLGAEFVFR